MSARIVANNFADLITQLKDATPEQLKVTEAYWAALPGFTRFPGPQGPPDTGPGTGDGGRPGPRVTDHIDVTPANLGLDDDLVAHALHALSQFGDLTPSEARRLLSKWARRDQLTDGQVAEVLAYYPPTLRAVS
jgi:hypothetical protein